MPGPVARPGIDRIKAHMIPTAPPGAEAILLHSNESAYGPSPRAAQAMRDAVTGVERYFEFPDRVMAPAIAAHHGLDADRIVSGQGSDDLLARVARAYLGPGDTLIRTANGYLKVPNYAYACGADVVSVPDDGFVPSVDRMIAALTDRTRIVYLANPENPAGTWLTDAEVRRLHAALPEHVLLVLDCAYEEYVESPDHAPPHRLVEDAQNVVMARTFSKIYGLAGARVGWLYGPPPVVDVVRRVGLTFPVASASAAAALAALEDTAHTAMVRRETLAERARLTAALTGLGLPVVPSQTNFVLCHFADPQRSAMAAEAYLAKRNILVRRLASPAYADHIRITLGLPEQNAAALQGLADFLNGAA